MPNKPKQSTQGFWYKSTLTTAAKELQVAKSKDDFKANRYDRYREDATGTFTYFANGDRTGVKMTSPAYLFDPSTHSPTTESLKNLFHNPDFVGFETSINDVEGLLPAHVFTRSGKHIGHIGKLGGEPAVVYFLDTEETILRSDPEPNSLRIYLKKLEINYQTLTKLAGVVYAESGVHTNSKEEKFGIASACLNVNNKKGASLAGLSATLSKISNATFDGNPRFTTFVQLEPERRNQNAEMTLSILAAINAAMGGQDYSNGAVGWDGPDLRNNLHTKGFHILPEHDLFGMGDQPTVVGSNKTYYYRESTAAYGRTIFFKISDVHSKAGGRDY